MSTRENIYLSRIAHYEKFQQTLRQVFGRISTLRTMAAAVAIGTYVMGVYFTPSLPYYAVSILFLLSFIVGISRHRKLKKRLKEVDTLLTINREGALRLQDRWTEFTVTGEEFLDSRKPHLNDLNLFGPNSLYQMIQLISTTRGARILADWIGACYDFSIIPKRQEAIKEIAPRISMRQHLLMGGRLLGKPLKPSRFLEWLESPSYLTQNRWIVYLQRFLVLTTVALMVLDGFLDIPPLWSIVLLIQAVFFVKTSDKCRKHYLPALNQDSIFLSYAAMFKHLEEQPFKSEYLRQIHSKLFIGTEGISHQMRHLEKINSALCLYYGSLYPFINMILLWDIHFLYQLEQWKESVADSMDRCFEALGEMEALSSLAGFSYDHPDYAFPMISSDHVPLSAGEMGHPLIPGKNRVHNDFEIPTEGFLGIITGSNMSGKSTFVRTVGINMSLAFSGAPVTARRFSARPCALLTCIQVFESLQLHVSHFYAEVKGIKRILDAVQKYDSGDEPLPVLFLVDEIFSGTNTKERLIASKGIMLKLAGSKSYGLITTHDLELVTLENHSNRVRNYHFKDEIDGNGKMVFHYQIHKGPVSSTNALELLRREGIYL